MDCHLPCVQALADQASSIPQTPFEALFHHVSPPFLNNQPESNQPSSNHTTDVRKRFAPMLIQNRIDALQIGPLRLWDIHHRLFDLLDPNHPLDQGSKDLWKTMTGSHAMQAILSGPRMFKDAQQHAIAEQVHELVRLVLYGMNVLTEEGCRVRDRNQAANSTASKAVPYSSDEGCYIVECNPGYIMEIKQVDASLDAIYKVSRFAEVPDSHPVLSDGSIGWNNLENIPDFGKAEQLIIQIYAQLHANKSQICVVMCCDALIVVRLTGKNSLAVSAVIPRGAGTRNRRAGTGQYERDVTTKKWVWRPAQGNRSVVVPLPTILSTLSALTMCPLPSKPDDFWLDLSSPSSGLYTVPETRATSQDERQPSATSGSRNTGYGGGDQPALPNQPGASNEEFSPAAASEAYKGSASFDIDRNLTYIPGEIDRETSLIEENVMTIQVEHEAPRQLWLFGDWMQFDPSSLIWYAYENVEGSNPSFPHEIGFDLTTRDPPEYLVKSHMQVHDQLGHGRVWTTYAADLWQSLVHEESTQESLDSATLPIKTVIKFACPSFPMTYYSSSDLGEYSSVKHHREAVLREMQIYDGPLKELQGKVVPQCHSMMRARVSISYPSIGQADGERGRSPSIIDDDGKEEPIYIYAMVLDRLSYSKPPQYRHPVESSRIVNLYKQLHAVKVCHRDVKLSHILHTGCDGLGCKYFRLIDFEGAKMECSSQEMEQEMERVRWIARQGR